MKLARLRLEFDILATPDEALELMRCYREQERLRLSRFGISCSEVNAAIITGVERATAVNKEDVAALFTLKAIMIV